MEGNTKEVKKDAYLGVKNTSENVTEVLQGFGKKCGM